MEAKTFTPKTLTEAGDIPTLCVKFLEWLGSRGRAATTISSYRIDLEQFAGFMASRDITLIQAVAVHHIEDFLTTLMHGKGLKPRSAARKLETVRGLFGFAQLRGFITERSNPVLHVEAPKFDDAPVTAPPEELLEEFLRSIPTDTHVGLRDRAFFMLMYDAALRVGGVLSLDLHDEANPPDCCVHPSGRVTYRNKGGRVKESFCGEATLAAIRDYLAVRHKFSKARHSQALFVATRKARMTRQTMHQRIKKYAKPTALPFLHMHLLRHGRANGVIQKVGLREASVMLGHKNEQVTRNQYGHEDAQRVRRRIEQGAPIGIKEAA